ncbi:endo-1,4-beta-xylanase [Nocardiopsis mangrovi]|uniref:Beta-xylanase n=1 Tax=Nocardiopsis mangrovi TaxID=1179818 RepID=A0ABV9DTZ0_9ACTN
MHRQCRVAAPGRALRWGAVLAAAACLAMGAAPASAQADDRTLRELADAQGFRIGSGVEAWLLNGEQRYRDIAAAQFNSLTPGNEMKWASVEPSRGQFNWSGADTIVNTARANDQLVYGHTLVWHSQLPSWLNNGGFSPAQLRTLMNDHIATTAGRYAGDIYAWDVVNEPFNEDGSMRNTIWYNNLGSGYIAEALRAARAADPQAKLYLNDYNIEGINAKSDAMYRLARSLLQQGVPLDGIGIQSHLILGQVPSSMQQNIQRFADLGLEVTITELDVRIQTPADQQELATQAEDYRKVVTACVNVDGCTGVTIWGITDAHSWIPSTFPGYGAALPYDENYAPKPAYQATHEALGGDPAASPR